ncbi:MAG TPA: NUDIX domain-containing protein [Rhizomicrobium sp.]|jgi:8-oxo-dGTP pyrophosphatase MutT (NUDIX family)|nr:NUDIX domain-containing protein [Rhizomicrobium sp.]
MARTGYVARIREKIGSDLLMLHAVSVLVFDTKGRVLLAQQRGGDFWMTVGGAVEIDETPAEAAMREFWEETGTIVRITRVLGVFGGPDFRVTYGNGDAVAYTSVAFEAELVSGIPAPDGRELARLAWFSPDEIAQAKMADGMRRLLLNCVAGRSETYFDTADWMPPSR